MEPGDDGRCSSAFQRGAAGLAQHVQTELGRGFLPSRPDTQSFLPVGCKGICMHGQGLKPSRLPTGLFGLGEVRWAS